MPCRHRPLRFAAVLVAALPASLSFGQAEPEESGAAATPADFRLLDDTEFAVTVGAWIPRLGGDTLFGPAAGDRTISLENEFDLDSSEATFNLEVTLRRHEVWELFISGFDFSTDDSGTFPTTAEFGGLALSPGDPYRASFDISSFTAEMTLHTWRIYGENAGEPGVGDTDFRFALAVGTRYAQVEQTVTQIGVGREKGRAQWLFPYAALGLELRYPDENDRVPWLHMLEVDASLGIGPALGGDSGYMWQVRAGATWHFTPNVGAMFGYRLVEFDAEDDDFDVQAGLQGLFLAATIRF
jgi:hypothetical protein